MSTTLHNKNDKMELEIFDSFSKKVMRNTGRNIASASKTIKANGTVSNYVWVFEHKFDQYRSGYFAIGEKVGQAWNAGKKLMNK